MKRFLKIALVAAVVLAFIVPAGLNFFVGGQLGDREMLAQATRPGFDVVDASVDRNLFSSNQVLTLRPSDMPENAWLNTLLGRSPGNDGADLVVRNTIRPGPIPIGPPGEGALRPAFANARTELALRDRSGAETALPGVFYTRVTPIGSHHRFVLDDGAVELAGADGPVKLNGRGVDVSLSRGSKIDITGRVDALLVSSGTDTLTVDSLDFDASNALAEGIAEFAARITAKGLGAVTANDKSLGSVKDLDLFTEMAVDGDAGHLALTARGNGLAEGKKANFDIDLRYDTTAEALRTLTTIGRALAAEKAGAPQDLNRLLGDVSALLSAGGHLMIDKLYVDTDDGPISANADLDLAPGATNPLAALTSMEGGGKIQLPVALVRALQQDTEGPGQNITMALQMRLLKRDGQSYHSEFELKNGILSVNGIPLPIPLLGR